MTSATTSNLPSPVQTQASPAATPSLRRLAVRATAWTIIGTYGGQALRLASNLILTRLLFPEAFGVMAIILLVLQSLNLFSDIGIQQLLIQHPRSEERWFSDTAWTIQVIRGVLLWLAACAVAAGLHLASAAGWLPAQSAFADPRLVTLLPVAGLTLIAVGFSSTNLIALRRHMTLGYEAAFQLSQQFIQVLIMVAWAWLYPSVWALVGGTIIGSLLAAVASHYVLPGTRNRFTWNRQAAAELFRFGRYIFVSTLFTFLTLNAQRTILGSFLNTDLFGIYSIALVLSTVILAAMDRMHASVLFPLYSQLARRNDPVAMGANIRRVRLRLLAISLPPMCGVAIFGRHIVELFYDARYHDAGWMLQLLAVATIITIVSLTLRPVMLAHGHASRHIAYTAISSLFLLTCLLIGAFTGGVMGVLVGAVVGEIIGHVVLLGIVRRYSIWTAGLDFAALAISAAVIAIGWGALRM